jgi:hypothetical protein
MGNDLDFESNLISDKVQFILSFARLDGLSMVKNLFQTERNSFEELKYTVSESQIVVEEFKGSAFWNMTGRQIGPFNGVPASFNQVNVPGSSLFNFDESGKITAIHIQIDLLSLLTQINGVKKLYDF